MSESLNTFKRAISDANVLIECYDQLDASPEKQAREMLNMWLKKRGDAVHSAQVEIGIPDIV